MAGHAVRQDARCIGWLPWQFYESHQAAGTLAGCWRNGDLVGFVAWSPGPLGVGRVDQIWVRRDARRLVHGLALLRWLRRRGRAAGQVGLHLWCGADLPANEFWRAMGLVNDGQRLGKGSALVRGAGLRVHEHWSESWAM